MIFPTRLACLSVCEFVLMVAVIGGQDRVAGHAHETAVNAGLDREIAVGGQDREIDDVDQSRVIEENIDPGHVHENICGGKTSPVEAVLMMKSGMRKNCPLIQLWDTYVLLISVRVLSVVLTTQ